MGRRHYSVTLADAIVAHDEALTYGGRQGINSLHLIESALARPYSGYYRRIHSKAAALMHSIVSNHGFADGNKRTALIVSELMIERSGYHLIIPEHERFDDIIVAVASGEMDFHALEDWFKQRLVRAA